jgi:4a-hydroxytetrahydrobiopterin dehydratase
MSKREPLNADRIRQSLADLPDWRHEGDALRKTYTFGDFREAFAFMTRVAFEAEARDHHPDWKNVYNSVEIALNTHDAGGKVTEMDVELAKAIERIQA